MTEQNQMTVRKNQVAAIFNENATERLLPYFNNDRSKADKFKQTLAMIAMNDKFSNVEPASIFKCGINCAEVGLSPQPILGQAYFVTYNKKLEFSIGTNGYITLLERAKKALKAYLVYDVDDFKLTIDGFEETFKLTQNFKERREADTKWVDQHLRGGLVLIKDLITGIVTTTFVSVDILKSLRARSPSFRGSAAQYSPWNTSAATMFLIKAIRHTVKRTNLDEKAGDLIKALSYESDKEDLEAVTSEEVVQQEKPKPIEISEDDQARLDLSDFLRKDQGMTLEKSLQFVHEQTGKKLSDLNAMECEPVYRLFDAPENMDQEPVENETQIPEPIQGEVVSQELKANPYLQGDR